MHKSELIKESYNFVLYWKHCNDEGKSLENCLSKIKKIISKSLKQIYVKAYNAIGQASLNP